MPTPRQHFEEIKHMLLEHRLVLIACIDAWPLDSGSPWETLPESVDGILKDLCFGVGKADVRAHPHQAAKYASLTNRPDNPVPGAIRIRPEKERNIPSSLVKSAGDEGRYSTPLGVGDLPE